MDSNSTLVQSPQQGDEAPKGVGTLSPGRRLSVVIEIVFVDPGKDNPLKVSVLHLLFVLRIRVVVLPAALPKPGFRAM